MKEKSERGLRLRERIIKLQSNKILVLFFDNVEKKKRETILYIG